METGSCTMARLEMTKKPSRRVFEEAAATPSDVRAAIEALTSADWSRLRNYAANRIRKLGPKADGRSTDDLLQITLVLLLNDTRRWDRTRVEFVPFLIGAMKSISSNWARGYKPEETLSLELDVEKTKEDGEKFRPVEFVEDGNPNPEQRLVDEEQLLADARRLKMIDELFKGDEGAQMVIEAWRDGYDPPGVRTLWELSQNDYNTIVRRIRRTIDRFGLGERGSHGR